MADKSVISLILITLFLLGCRSGKPETEISNTEIVPVVTYTSKKITSQKIISLSGNVEGNKTVRLGFLVAGRIDFIAVNEGEKVSKGMLLSSLDPASYSIAKELADIQVNQVQDEFNRLKLMHDSSSISESDFAKVTYGLHLAKAQQKLHSKNLSDTKLYSPIDGVLLKKLAEVGEITGVGIPAFAVSDISKVKISAFLPENELHEIRIGQDAALFIPALNTGFKGRITEVGSAADPSARAFLVKIESANPGLRMRPGMIAEIKITTESRYEAIGIPVEALIHDFNDQSYIFVVDTIRKKAFRRNVSTGKLLGKSIEITSGLGENEAVVTGGQQKLFNGTMVHIVK